MSKPLWLGKDVVGGVPSQQRPDRRPPDHWRLEDVFATARPHHPALSPDKARIAFALDIEGTTDIWSIDVGGRALTRITTNRELIAFWVDSAPVWSPDGTRIAYDSEGSVQIVPAAGGPSRRLLVGSTGTWVDDDRLAVIVERQGCSRLAVVDIDDPWPSPLGPTDGDVGRAQVAPDGRILLSFYPKDDFSRNDVVLIDPDGSWTTLVGHADRRAGNHVVHGNRVAYTLEEGDWSGVFLTDLDGDKHTRLAAGERDFSSLAWDDDGQSLLAIATARGMADLVRIGLDGAVEVVAEGGTWDSPMPVAQGVVAIHEAHDSPASITFLGADGTRSILYDGAPAAIRSAPHSKLERITFNSSDGLEIEGFLFRPADTSNPVPAVVYPHGGPTSYYGDEWDGHAQYFVDKGYAWLAINFRGSTTYGLSFERANHGDWGGGDVEDCLAAAGYLSGRGWVDPNRIAIHGVSYGSYLTFASLVHPDNPFACGASKYGGDIDLLTSWAQGDREGREDLERMMGHPAQDRRGYHAGSPIHQVERIRRPLLLAHGERDMRVSVKQAEELVEALDQIGATYEYFTYPTTGHGLLSREVQLHFYRRLERFLDWYLM
ncbi:MAG TPA: S9 family peptidase [Acidimicrobiia bacterium]|nr:S9 family peptidase [Acidimicrobiia bacterium]